MDALPTPTIHAIRGGLVFDGDGFAEKDVAIADGAFTAVADAGFPTRGETGGAAAGTIGAGMLDASGCYVIPGLIDIHTHGCMGEDFSDGDANGLHRIAAFEASRGVTAWCPTSMTFPFEVLRAAFSTAASFGPAPGEATLAGINMEGPYISPRKVGAQNPAYVRAASIEEFSALQEAAGGLVRLVDIAPEEPGNLDFIDRACGDVCVSVAHTCADYDCAVEAFERGARHMTHLFNAMPGLHHREPGPIAAAAERDDVTVELICDGIHVHPAMVRLAFELFGRDRVVLISDTMRACGLDDGTYDLGGQDVTVYGPRATLADGTLAGSVTDLMGCLCTAVLQMGVPLPAAVRAATLNPARAIGLDYERGSIEPGKVADAVLLDQGTLEVRHVVLRGRLVV